jgi:hypothetical protein
MLVSQFLKDTKIKCGGERKTGQKKERDKESKEAQRKKGRDREIKRAYEKERERDNGGKIERKIVPFLCSIWS